MRIIMNSSFYNDLILFTFGFILLVYSCLNATISLPPNDLQTISTNYGKTYCIPVETFPANSTSFQESIKRGMSRSFGLLVMSFIVSIYLLLTSSRGILCALY